MTSHSEPVVASAARQNPLVRPTPHPVRSVIVAVATAVVLIAVGLLLRAVPLDVAVSAQLNALQHGLLGHVTRAFYLSLKPGPAAAVTALAAIVVVAVTRRWQVALTFVGTIGVTWGLAELLKLVVDRPRPGLSVAAHQMTERTVDASFPSGHVAFTTALVVALVVALWDSRSRVAAIAIGVGLVMMMIVSVVVVGVHYAGDAVASVFWVAGVFPAVRAGWAMVVVPRIAALVARTPGQRRRAVR
ncbi:phosphatase PAP2 family protein [Microbacterium trichothecenolyticum]|uniref:Membrane-associated phospholipid phosphatase n=1 Tax=Microbacterium trichothecenolyticum TaxID=69370 RepID=A0ABU0TYY0_MICTR|nr:phosphatase PAP2 family protein [Microbacterium trichothecenolyticum]MDQ1124870.1 membrane-associated phospholipid phosphatase [Microbacterium trichothecenolyticum]